MCELARYSLTGDCVQVKVEVAGTLPNLRPPPHHRTGRQGGTQLGKQTLPAILTHHYAPLLPFPMVSRLVRAFCSENPGADGRAGKCHAVAGALLEPSVYVCVLGQ